MQFNKVIENVNVITSTYTDERLGDISLDPIKGKVAFGSGLHQWGFTLKKFGKMYSSKFNISRFKMVRRLWGDMFYNKKGEWKRGSLSGDKEWKRGFVAMVLDPIYQMFDAIMNDKKEKYEKMLTSLGVTLKSEDRGAWATASYDGRVAILFYPPTPPPLPPPPRPPACRAHEQGTAQALHAEVDARR